MAGEVMSVSSWRGERKGNGEALEHEVYMFATSVLARRQR